MYHDGFDRPTLRKIISFAVLSGILIPIGVGFSDPANPLDWWNLCSLALIATGLTLGLFSIALGIYYANAVFMDAAERRKEIEAITPRRREIEAIGLLTKEQLQVVPRMDHGAKITERADRDGSGKWVTSVWFSTPGGEIPIEFIQDFLKNSGYLQLHPVNSYGEGSYNYYYARWFTDWLRKEQLAIGGEGSKAGQAAQWIAPGARAEVYKLFDIELDLNKVET